MAPIWRLLLVAAAVFAAVAQNHARAQAVPLEHPVAEISIALRELQSKPEIVAGIAPADRPRWLAFDVVNPVDAPILRRLDLEPASIGPFGSFWAARGSPWVAISVQGEGVSAAMIPGREGYTADIRLEPKAKATVILQLRNVEVEGAWRLWQPQAWDKTIAQAMMLRGLFAGALIAAAAWLTGLAVLRFAAAPFWGGVSVLAALALLLGSAGIVNLGLGGLALAGAAFAATALRFLTISLEMPKDRRPWTLAAEASGVLAIAMALVAAMGLEIATSILAIMLGVAGLLSLGIVGIELAGGNSRAKSLVMAVFIILLAGLAPALLPDSWRAAMTGWPLILDGAFVMGLLLMAFAAAAPRKPVLSEDEADQLLQERRAAREGQHRYALGLAAAHQGLWDWNIEAGTLYVSPSVEAMLGLSQGSLGTSERAWAALVHPDDARTYEEGIATYRSKGNASFTLDVRMRHARGAIRWMQLKASCIAGRRGDASRCIGIVSDITELKQKEAVKPHEEKLDKETGLASRSLFLNRLDQVFATMAQAGVSPRGVVMAIEVDRVRAVKENLGEVAGDRFLNDIADALQDAAGPADILARVGSHEFAMLLLPDDYGNAPDTAVMRVRDALASPVHVGVQDIYPAASIGAVELAQRHRLGGDALREAEVAMHHAQRSGLGGFEVFKPEMRTNSAERLTLDADLRRALERNQIEIVFQPIIALRQGAVAGFEALMRWRHHQRGVINPMEFIPLAEETGLIVPLGTFMLRQAAEQLARWQQIYPAKQPYFMSVNVSPRQLFRNDFEREIQAALQSSPVAPHSLRLEITESVVMSDPEKSAQALKQVKALGIGLAIDDFGTGYSSLSQLQRFPFDALKIDRSFVQTMTESSNAKTIVKSIVALGQSLNMAVIAEGVESQPEAIALAQLGCDFAQGYLFGGPLEIRNAEKLLAAQQQTALSTIQAVRRSGPATMPRKL